MSEAKQTDSLPPGAGFRELHCMRFRVVAWLACLTLLQSCTSNYQAKQVPLAAPFQSGDQLVIRTEVYRQRDVEGLAHSREGAASEGWHAGWDDVWNRGCAMEACAIFPFAGPIMAATAGAAQATIGHATGLDVSRDEILQATIAIKREFQPAQFQPNMQEEITKRLARQLEVNEAVCRSEAIDRSFCSGSGRTGSIHASFAFSVAPSKAAAKGQLDIVVNVSAAAQPAGMFPRECARFTYFAPIGHLLDFSDASDLKAVQSAAVRDLASIVALVLTSQDADIALNDATVTAIQHRRSDCLRNIEFAREAS